MLLLALILFKSLAMPEIACAIMTYTAFITVKSTSNKLNATICSTKPNCMVKVRPILAPNQPPYKLVTMPKSS